MTTHSTSAIWCRIGSGTRPTQLRRSPLAMGVSRPPGNPPLAALRPEGAADDGRTMFAFCSTWYRGPSPDSYLRRSRWQLILGGLISDERGVRPA
jgi:hypothetical protein